jgi:predicted RNA polymerase sigma factor
MVTRALVAAEAYRLRGDSTAARTGFESVATLLSADRTHPDDPIAHIGRGMAVASLGRRAETLREVRWLERFEAQRQDHHDSGPAYWRARMLARVGESDAALRVIERLLAGPSLFSVHELRINPDFDPIRGDSRYQALIRKYGG